MPRIAELRNRRTLRPTLALLTIFLVLPLDAQDLLTVITTEDIHFDNGTDHGDGPTSEAEIKLVINWTAPETSQVITVEAENSLCFMCAGNDPHVATPTMASYLECSPYDPVSGSGDIWEVDSSLVGGLVVAGVSIVAGIGGLIAEVLSAGTATFGVVGLGGTVIGAAWALNSDEHLGSLPIKKFPLMPGGSPGHADDLRWDALPNTKLETESDHGNPRVYLNVRSGPPALLPDDPIRGGVMVASPDDGVCPPPATPYLLGLADIRDRYDQLSELYGDVDSYVNEAEFDLLTLDGLSSSRQAVRDNFFGVAAMTAGALAELARPYEGGEIAWQRFQTGLVEYAEGAAPAAFLSMREAAATAYDVFFYQNGGGLEGSGLASPPFGGGGGPGDAVLLLNTATLLMPRAEGASMRVGGKVFGLAAGEDVVSVAVEDITLAGLAAVTVPGTQLSGVAIHADLATEMEAAGIEGTGEGHVFGLRRFASASVAPADAGCAEPHLVPDGSAGDAAFIDGLGPFTDPDPEGCGFGAVTNLNLSIDRGGIPASATYEGGVFNLLFELDEGIAIPPGHYPLTVTAKILEAGGGERTVSTPLTLVVPSRHTDPALFQEDFESGSLQFWSMVQGG